MDKPQNEPILNADGRMETRDKLISDGSNVNTYCKFSDGNSM
jgi:hypothetical protein